VKDAKIYDGSGWQSLKGPPGPSEPSADEGNIITKGSDGLLLYTGVTEEGNWIPLIYEENDSGDYFEGWGLYRVLGDHVFAAGQIEVPPDVGEAFASSREFILAGLPYSIDGFGQTLSGLVNRFVQRGAMVGSAIPFTDSVYCRIVGRVDDASSPSPSVLNDGRPNNVAFAFSYSYFRTK
jgi:hypothetical protein